MGEELVQDKRRVHGIGFEPGCLVLLSHLARVDHGRMAGSPSCSQWVARMLPEESPIGQRVPSRFPLAQV